MSTVLVGVCVKQVDRRPEVDSRTGAVHTDARSMGLSAADEAAIEIALRAGEKWSAEVIVATAGPAGADDVLRAALACGVHRARRVTLTGPTPSDVVATLLATALRDCALVVCGDHSLDRGSGAVPAHLAAELDAAQALGLVAVELGPPGTIEAVRRLDGGRRELVRVTAPAVVSVEGSVARLRRAPLAGVLAARTATIDVQPGPRLVHAPGTTVRPFRPRARVVDPPAGATALARVQTILGAGQAAASSTTSAPVTLGPAEAADRILRTLGEWGYEWPGRDDTSASGSA